MNTTSCTPSASISFTSTLSMPTTLLDTTRGADPYTNSPTEPGPEFTKRKRLPTRSLASPTRMSSCLAGRTKNGRPGRGKWAQASPLQGLHNQAAGATYSAATVQRTHPSPLTSNSVSSSGLFRTTSWLVTTWGVDENMSTAPVFSSHTTDACVRYTKSVTSSPGNQIPWLPEQWKAHAAKAPAAASAL
jgi:hypothetical protein